MINWDELKHFHVIRKLQEILAHWFQMDIFFLDERGELRNLDLKNKEISLNNPLARAFMNHEKGKLLLFNAFKEVSEKLLSSEKATLLAPGPLGVETLLASRICVGNEFLGSVIAYSYLEKEITPSEMDRALAALSALGLEREPFASAIAPLKIMSEFQNPYFEELVSLVVQEIISFHTEITAREEQIHQLNDQLGVRYSYDSMIGKSKPMQELYSLLDKIKNSEATVLIQGENGTGKELIARAIHFNSGRKGTQFVTVNCSAFNENLLDSELFGHVKGAFTGAIKDKKGLFEVAHGGTLFLDEIGDMPLAMQVKLLRVLQNGTLTPVGSTETKQVDVRVVAATNKDLKEMIEEGLFREDLYYRVNVINLVVPPLRDRKEDIPMLVDHFLGRECKEKKLAMKRLAKRALEKIFDYPWPGNIRELENEIERLVVLSGADDRIGSELLSSRIRDFGVLHIDGRNPSGWKTKRCPGGVRENAH